MKDLDATKKIRVDGDVLCVMNKRLGVSLIDTTLIPVSCIRAHFWLSGSM